ncbi:MAG: hypothetical protein RRY07_10675, partial [Bacteroidaceae bacterium]
FFFVFRHCEPKVKQSSGVSILFLFLFLDGYGSSSCYRVVFWIASPSLAMTGRKGSASRS